jgi:glycine hydroxymethyltransferase
VPGDPESPFVTSGIRLGSAALTTRGMGEGEMRQVAALIDAALTAPGEAGLDHVRRGVRELTLAFPLADAPARVAG